VGHPAFYYNHGDVETSIRNSWEVILIPRLLAVLLLMGSALAQDVVHYTTTTANVKYLFATAEPVLRLKSGDILDTNTLDCFGNGLKKPGDTLSMATGDNPLAGPFYVDGAEPGDTLAVKILDLQVDGDTGVGAFAPGFGAINETNYTPMLHAPLPERVWFYHIDHAANTATFKALDSDFSVKIPMHPFFGSLAWLRRTARRAVRWCRRSLAGTWILPRPAWGIRFIFR
jgi:Acetamidase/Formamidase family